MEIKGHIIHLLRLESGMGKKGEWKKQSFVLETDGQYPKKLALEVWNDKIAQFALRVGDVVTAHMDPESKEYNGKWYTQIRCWKLEKHSSGPVVNTPAAGSSPSTDPAWPEAVTDDLPF